MNQNVDVLGRRFHVQTEVVSGDRARISTTVFVGGRVVAKREVALDPLARDEDEIRDQLNEHHSRIIENLRTRATALTAERQQPAKPERRVPIRPSVVTTPRQKPGRPFPDEDEQLEASLVVRRLLARFRTFVVQVRTPADTEGLVQRLRAAHEVVSRMMDDPVFPGVRLDEQVRFFDLKDKLPSVLAEPVDGEAAAAVWAEIVTFAGYLGNVSQRRELVDFDRRAISWALDASAQDGMTDEVLETLGWSYGLDYGLDRLLDGPAGVAVDTWRELMFAILDRLGSEPREVDPA